jgi:hypothetical protein
LATESSSLKFKISGWPARASVLEKPNMQSLTGQCFRANTNNLCKIFERKNKAVMVKTTSKKRCPLTLASLMVS